MVMSSKCLLKCLKENLKENIKEKEGKTNKHVIKCERIEKREMN